MTPTTFYFGKCTMPWRQIPINLPNKSATCGNGAQMNSHGEFRVFRGDIKWFDWSAAVKSLYRHEIALIFFGSA
jgi:hypothetical protein